MRKYIIGKLLYKLGYNLERIRAIKKDDLKTYQDLYSEDSLFNRRFYNIGAGQFLHPYWTIIDKRNNCYKDNPPPDIEFDLLSGERLPIEDNSTELIYCSHVLEHLDNKAAQNILNESYRILKEEGIIRIIVPDIELGLNAWLKNDNSFFEFERHLNSKRGLKKVPSRIKIKDASIRQKFLYYFASSISEIHGDGEEERISDIKFIQLISEIDEKELYKFLDYCINRCSLEKQRIYPINHINWFDETKLRQMLKKAGFSHIYRSGYLQSKEPVLRNKYYFDKCFYHISLYMEAIK